MKDAARAGRQKSQLPSMRALLLPLLVAVLGYEVGGEQQEHVPIEIFLHVLVAREAGEEGVLDLYEMFGVGWAMRSGVVRVELWG